MKTKIQLLLIIIITCLDINAQKSVHPEYSGVEYVRLKSELARGWNTWNTKSVLSHVLLPEAISVEFYLKDKISGKILKEALMGKRGKEAETIFPLAHSYDGSYTELIINWSDIKIRVQSCANNKDVSFLLTPLGENAAGEILVTPQKIWWDREGKIETGKDLLMYNLPSGKIKLFAVGKTSGEGESSTSGQLTYSAASGITLTSEANLSVSDVRVKIQTAKANHEANKLKYGENKEVYNAMQNVLAWDMIYDPEGKRELTTVSRVWNMQRGGFVIFCWDNYFAAYMHALDNKNLAYANAIEMIKEHFYNPDEFLGDYILPSIAFNDPDYKANDYWRGRIWAPMNFLVYLGMRNYQLENARKDLVAKSKELFLSQWLNKGYICENYNSQTGECDDVNRCELFYHWGGLLGFISLIEDGYLEGGKNVLK